MAIQIPATSSSAKPVVVPDHFKLADNLQLALNQLGDGFFALKGTVTTGPLTGRTLKSLNGEVIPGTGLQVKVRDFAALIDGVVCGDKNKEQIDFETFETLAVTVGTKYIVMEPEKIKGSDGFDRPDFARGILSAQTSAPVIDTGVILVAQLNIPTGTTQVTSSMINMLMKPYLADLGVERFDRITQDAILSAQIGAGGSDLDATINIAKTNFKVDTLLHVNNNALFNGFVDVFNSGSDIDSGLSTVGYKVDQVLKLVKLDPGTPANLQGYWKMDVDNSSVLIDEIGGDNGSWPLATYGPGRSGLGVLNTPTDFSTIPYNPVNLNTSPNWTISVWAKFDVSGASGTILGNHAGDDSNFFYLYVYANNQGVLDTRPFGVSVGQGDAVPAVPYGTNWNHFAVTSELGVGLKIYVNGVQVGHNDGSAPRTAGAAQALWLGSLQGFARGDGFPGTLDELAIFDRTLSAADLLDIYSTVDLVNAPAAPPINVISKAHTATFVPTDAMVVAEGTDLGTMYVSRDNGTTYTACPNNTLTSIAGQPSGSAMRYKVVLPALTSQLDNIAVFWK